MCCLFCCTTDQNFGREKIIMETVALNAVVAGRVTPIPIPTASGASGASPVMKHGSSRPSIKPFIFSPDRAHIVTGDANVDIAAAIGSIVSGVDL